MDFPLATIRVTNPRSNITNPAPVNVYKIYDLYREIGLNGDKLIWWQHKYGVAGSGRDEFGTPIIPNFPILSKTVWMHIEPVVIPCEDLEDLKIEIDRAISLSTGSNVSDVFIAIRSLIKFAVEHSCDLEFGHP